MKNRLLWGILVGGLVIVVLGASYIQINAPDTTSVGLEQQQSETVTCLTAPDDTCLVFPQVSGNDLDNVVHTFPDEFAGDYNFVVMPFDRDQQISAMDWLPLAEELASTYADFRYYSIAALPDLAPAIRLLVSGGLSAFVTEPELRTITVILYLEDQALFGEALGTADFEQIRVFVFNQVGEILWQAAGAFDIEKGDTLREFLASAEHK